MSHETLASSQRNQHDGCGWRRGAVVFAGPDRTVFEPSANDPRILAVLDTQKRAQAAAARADWKAVEEFFAPDVVVHAPINRVVNLDDIMGRFRNAQIGVWKLAVRQATVTSVQ